VLEKLKILKINLLAAYKSSVKPNFNGVFGCVLDGSKENFELDFYATSAATYSTNIEGNSVDFDSSIKYKEHNFKLREKEVVELNNLIKANELRQKNELSDKNLELANKMYGKGFIPLPYLGKYHDRTLSLKDGSELVSMAIEPEFIKLDIQKSFGDINYLEKDSFSAEEAFYFAAMIHLAFMHIRPFIDGNGRATRLLEKWSPAKKLGPKAWNIPKEKNYFNNRITCCNNHQLGGNNYVINYNSSLPFLLMPPNSLIC